MLEINKQTRYMDGDSYSYATPEINLIYFFRKDHFIAERKHFCIDVFYGDTMASVPITTSNNITKWLVYPKAIELTARISPRRHFVHCIVKCSSVNLELETAKCETLLSIITGFVDCVHRPVF
jgi:hypothetical protein